MIVKNVILDKPVKLWKLDTNNWWNLKDNELNKSAVAAHFGSHKHKFEEEPNLVKHINNRPLSELLIWEKNFIKKTKKLQLILIYLSSMTFSNWWMLKMVDRGSNRQLSLQAADDGVNRALKALLLKVSEVKQNV